MLGYVISAKFSTKCFKSGDHLVIDGEATAILPTLTLDELHSAD
uniref:Uncharacterized protein n=1 Tax=Rhizophora mucronata TaxID=61149 RepID=A0A2P2QHY0_RHIMU